MIVNSEPLVYKIVQIYGNIFLRNIAMDSIFVSNPTWSLLGIIADFHI